MALISGCGRATFTAVPLVITDPERPSERIFLSDILEAIYSPSTYLSALVFVQRGEGRPP